MRQKGVIVVFVFLFYGFAADEDIFEVYQYGQKNQHDQFYTQDSKTNYLEDNKPNQSQSYPQDIKTDPKQYNLGDLSQDEKHYKPLYQSSVLKPIFPQDSSLYQRQQQPGGSTPFDKQTNKNGLDVNQIQPNFVSPNNDKIQGQRYRQHPGQESNLQDQGLYDDIYNAYLGQQNNKIQTPFQRQLSKPQDSIISQRQSYPHESGFNHNQHLNQGLNVTPKESQQNPNVFTRQAQYYQEPSNSLDNNVEDIRRVDRISSESTEKSGSVISWLLEMGKRALQLQMRRRTGGGTRRQDISPLFDSIPGLAFMGATVGAQEAFEELLIKLLETIAFIICDILFSIYWPE